LLKEWQIKNDDTDTRTIVDNCWLFAKLRICFRPWMLLKRAISGATPSELATLRLQALRCRKVLEVNNATCLFPPAVHTNLIFAPNKVVTKTYSHDPITTCQRTQNYKHRQRMIHMVPCWCGALPLIPIGKSFGDVNAKSPTYWGAACATRFRRAITDFFISK